jgi:hypothetical protein
MFFSLLTEYGLTRWETLLNLPSMAENNTFSHRQARIQARFNRSLPYTLKRLREMLDNLIGIDNYTLNLDCSNYLIYFRINLSLSKVMPEAADLLKKTVPANMFIDASLIYIENSQLTNFTHEFLSTYTHMQIREKEPLNV